jgi:hypothetical protein
MRLPDLDRPDGINRRNISKQLHDVKQVENAPDQLCGVQDFVLAGSNRQCGDRR